MLKKNVAALCLCGIALSSALDATNVLNLSEDGLPEAEDMLLQPLNDQVVVPEEYNVQNGLIGMKRDIFLTLIFFHIRYGDYRIDSKTGLCHSGYSDVKSMFGIDQDAFPWKKHAIFVRCSSNKYIVDVIKVIFSDDKNKACTPLMNGLAGVGSIVRRFDAGYKDLIFVDLWKKVRCGLKDHNVPVVPFYKNLASTVTMLKMRTSRPMDFNTIFLYDFDWYPQDEESRIKFLSDSYEMAELSRKRRILRHELPIASSQQLLENYLIAMSYIKRSVFTDIGADFVNEAFCGMGYNWLLYDKSLEKQYLGVQFFHILHSLGSELGKFIGWLKTDFEARKAIKQ